MNNFKLIAVLALGFLACFCLVLAAGCSEQSAGRPEYRTILANPLADTAEARSHNRRGLELLAQGDLDAAQRAFEKALAADRQFGPAHNNLGKVFHKKGQFVKAAYEYDLAIESMPEHAGPYNNLGLLEEDGSKLDRAIELYRQALELDPGNLEYKGNLARAMSKRGESSDEHRQLLEEIARKDIRREWMLWARRELDEKYSGGE
jgi:Tfp pilus assembly protein PilF